MKRITLEQALSREDGQQRHHAPQGPPRSWDRVESVEGARMEVDRRAAREWSTDPIRKEMEEHLAPLADRVVDAYQSTGSTSVADYAAEIELVREVVEHYAGLWGEEVAKGRKGARGQLGGAIRSISEATARMLVVSWLKGARDVKSDWI